MRLIIVPCAVINFLFNQDNTRLKSSPSFSSLQYQDAGNYVCETALQEVEGLKKRESLTLIVEGNKILEHSFNFFSLRVCSLGNFMTFVQHLILILIIFQENLKSEWQKSLIPEACLKQSSAMWKGFQSLPYSGQLLVVEVL